MCGRRWSKVEGLICVDSDQMYRTKKGVYIGKFPSLVVAVPLSVVHRLSIQYLRISGRAQNNRRASSFTTKYLGCITSHMMTLSCSSDWGRSGRRIGYHTVVCEPCGTGCFPSLLSGGSRSTAGCGWLICRCWIRWRWGFPFSDQRCSRLGRDPKVPAGQGGVGVFCVGDADEEGRC